MKFVKILKESKKKYKYFAISDYDSGKYYTKQDMIKDLKNFGDDVEIKCYSLKNVDNEQELESEDLLFTWKNGKIIESLKEELSRQQQDFFKNSKVRDKDGNLIVCYHGTPNPGFKEFNPKDSKSQFGNYKFGKYNVNYFSKDRESASGYTEFKYDDGKNVYACYLNIVNPYIVDNKTEAEIKTSFNLKDTRLRDKQIKLFDSIFNKWKNKIMDYSDPRFQELNNDLRKLNLELRPNESYYDSDTDPKDVDYFNLYTLGNNSFFGAEHAIFYAYSTDEIFNDDMYDELKENIIGEPNDYFFSTDDIVRYVISLNEDESEDYDGIIIPDIYDSTQMFSAITTDYITLKSSNQIKLIDNINPTNSNRIDESNEEDKVEKVIKSRNYEQMSDIEMISYIYRGQLVRGQHYDNYKYGNGDKVFVYDAWINAKDKYSAVNKLRRRLGFGTLDKDEIDSNIEDTYCIVEESDYYDEEHDVTYQWYVTCEDVKIKRYDESLDKDTITFFTLNESKIYEYPQWVYDTALKYFNDGVSKCNIENISIKQLVDDNDLLNDNELQSYHQRSWNNSEAKDFHINQDIVNKYDRLSQVPFAYKKKDGKIELGDGKHRTRALYNDGYDYVKLPVIVNESLLNEVYPHKGESKKDFTKRFMKVTKDEYPDVKQRYAVCMSYWNRRNKKK